MADHHHAQILICTVAVSQRPKTVPCNDVLHLNVATFHTLVNLSPVDPPILVWKKPTPRVIENSRLKRAASTYIRKNIRKNITASFYTNLRPSHYTTVHSGPAPAQHISRDLEDKAHQPCFPFSPGADHQTFDMDLLDQGTSTSTAGRLPNHSDRKHEVTMTLERLSSIPGTLKNKRAS